MPVLRVPLQRLTSRVRVFLDPRRTSPGAVAWSGPRGTLGIRSVRVSAPAGWLVASIGVAATVGFGAAEVPVVGTVEIVFHLGTPGDGGGASAAATFSPASPPAIVAAWGPALRDRAWEAVLDVLEASALAAAADPTRPPTVTGFSTDGTTLLVEVA